MSQLGFVFLGARPALDFVNTLRCRKDPLTEQEDLLETLGLHSWLDAARSTTTWAEALPEWKDENADSASEDGAAQAQARQLRMAIYDLVKPHRSPANKTVAVNILNSFAGQLPTYALRTGVTGDNSDGDGLMVPSLTAQQLLGFLAADAIQLVGTANLAKVKECAHERCGILFEDRSNGMKRQWCSMKDCGNRAKVARFSSKN